MPPLVQKPVGAGLEAPSHGSLSYWSWPMFHQSISTDRFLILPTLIAAVGNIRPVLFIGEKCFFKADANLLEKARQHARRHTFFRTEDESTRF